MDSSGQELTRDCSVGKQVHMEETNLVWLQAFLEQEHLRPGIQMLKRVGILPLRAKKVSTGKIINLRCLYITRRLLWKKIQSRL